jgi:hypothetical protein
VDGDAPSDTAGETPSGQVAPTANDDGPAPTDDEPADQEETSDPAAEEEPAAEESAPEEIDTQAPTILDQYPAHQAQGVFAEDVIFIQFSEPMDQQITQMAYASTELPSDAVNFEWNEEGTELTIVPKEDLQYAVGWNPEDVDATRYTYALTGARDLAGNLLEYNQVQFDTARLILAAAPAVPAGTGIVRMSTGETDNDLAAGDLEDGDYVRGFTTFVLPELPADRLDLLVEFQTQQVIVAGDPFTNLTTDEHALCLMEASFASGSAVKDLILSTPIADLSTSADPGERKVDVTEVVEALYENGAPWAQFVLQFATPSDGPGADDVVGFDETQTLLAFGYLIK